MHFGRTRTRDKREIVGPQHHLRSATAMLGLGGYGSGSDDDEDENAAAATAAPALVLPALAAGALASDDDDDSGGNRGCSGGRDLRRRTAAGVLPSFEDALENAETPA